MVRIVSGLAHVLLAPLGVLAAGHAGAQAPVRQLEKLTYEEKDCGMGGCEVTRIVVRADGRVDYSYESPRVVRPPINIARTKVIPASQVQLLAKKVASARYFALRDRYGSSQRCPGHTDPGGRGIVTTIEADGRAKTIDHNHSCESAREAGGEAPSQLTELEQSIPQIVGTQQWQDEVKNLYQKKREQEQAARAAEAGPQFELGKALEREGKGTAAVAAYEKAALAGSCEASKRLGEIYGGGSLGVAKNDFSAQSWNAIAKLGGCVAK